MLTFQKYIDKFQGINNNHSKLEKFKSNVEIIKLKYTQ